jgi:hypothetical protein
VARSDVFIVSMVDLPDDLRVSTPMQAWLEIILAATDLIAAFPLSGVAHRRPHHLRRSPHSEYASMPPGGATV